ncbi:all-trans retinoic acid-induced differentiation factor isoform X1 [Calonectris borealis]|uniref:all-trans retinoic acid-induced differentiation factor isoform X1 n=1 Tax=Calonectris borealis TaxID=1323832 RepID=UPI003F4B0861
MGTFLLLLPLLLPGAAGGAAYCASRAGAESEGRCCRERGARPEHLLGLDLSDCSLRSLPPGLAEAAAAVVLDLTENPLRTLPSGSFLGFTHLQHLAVPLALECPGGSSAWEEVTTRGSSRLCQGQRNPCNSSGELSMAGDQGTMSPALGAAGLAGRGWPWPGPVTPSSAPPAWPCPENAACAPDGPGLVQCLCNSPFHGYKCLREGTFPVLLFCGILGAVTLSLSFLLWGTQRRKAKTP